MKNLLQALGSLLLLASLGACASSEERDACEARGGEVISKDYPYKGEGFWGSETGKLSHCSLDGQIVEVYNDEIEKVDEGFLGDSGKNRTIFEGCKDLEGPVYKTKKTINKTTYTRFVCVHAGAAVKILD